MRNALTLPREPTVHQASSILARIEEELTARGARVERDAAGVLRFRLPLPWQSPRQGLLLAISWGKATVSAGAGGPWRVRYELHFSRLRWATIALSVPVLVAGWGWPRLDLLNTLLVLWVLFFFSPYLAAGWRFHHLLRHCVAGVLERRRVPRPVPPLGGKG